VITLIITQLELTARDEPVGPMGVNRVDTNMLEILSSRNYVLFDIRRATNNVDYVKKNYAHIVNFYGYTVSFYLRITDIPDYPKYIINRWLFATYEKSQRPTIDRLLKPLKKHLDLLTTEKQITIYAKNRAYIIRIRPKFKNLPMNYGGR